MSGMKEEGIAYAKRFKGKYKILIRGNHDNLPDEFYIEKCGFTHVCASLKYGNYLFTHQPEIVRDPIINIHGHIHGTRAYVEGSPKNHMDVWIINSKHIDSLDKVVAAQEAYDKTTKQAKNINKADPYQHIQGENLNLEDIVTEGAIRKPFKYEAAGFESGSPVRSKVLFTKEISPESLVRIYEQLGVKLSGNIMIKISTGEDGKGPRYCLDPKLISKLVDEVDGVICDTNTAYEGSRSDSASHWKTIKKHGYMDIANCDILDEEGEYIIPVEDGLQISEVRAGTHTKNYESFIILSHFKGHAMAGFGGAMKNVAIGLSSANGKKIVHSGGHVTPNGIAGMTPDWDADSADKPVHEKFLKSMADVNKAFKNIFGDKVVYINVANNLSVDCDCAAEPAKPTMKDIGIFASTDPLAIDQACIDFVYDAPDSKDLIKRIEERHGTDLLTYAEKDGVGNRAYELVDIDSGSVITRNNLIKRGHELELEESAIFEVKFIDDKGKPVPRKCPSCGYKVGVFFRGEPVFLCTNRECNKYFGTVPFNESANHIPADWTCYYPKQAVNFLKEAAAYHSVPAPIPGSDAERNKHFDEVMEIVDALSQNERDDIAINGIYTDSPNVIDRRIARDSEGNPVGFIDVYFFRSNPFECQLTAAIKPGYRGQGYMHKMLADIVQAAPVGHPGVTKYVWNVDPNNIHSIKLATRCGFRKTGILRHRDDLDIDEDRYEYVLPFKEAEGTIPLPQRLLTESFNADGYVLTDDYIMTEDFITFFNGMDTQVISEAEKKYDSKLKRYLYKERLKNNKAVLLRYQQMKAMNPIIKRTFLKLPMYRRRNIFIDLSFYHGLFLEHLQFKKDVAVKMYWDFLNRLIVDNEYKDLYKKITIFIPVWTEAWGTNTAEDLMDYRKSINPISMIIRMLRKNPAELKKWGNKDILFVSPQGYFKVNFNKFELKDLTKFRRFITKLVSNEIIEEDEDEDGYTTAVNADDDTDSASVITAKIVDKLEKNTGVEIDDITGGQTNTFQPEEVETVLTPSKQEFTHLRVRAGKIELPTNGISKDGNQTKNPVKNAVLIMAPTGDKSADTFLNNQIAKNIITTNKRGYFSP